jgi:hypothetical protein
VTFRDPAEFFNKQIKIQDKWTNMDTNDSNPIPLTEKWRNCDFSKFKASFEFALFHRLCPASDEKPERLSERTAVEHCEEIRTSEIG